MTEIRWQVVFFGTSSFAVPTLKGLIEGPEEVVAVVTQPDRGKGRGQKVSASPVKELATQHRLMVLQPGKVKDRTFHENIEAFQPDLFVVVAYGHILPKSLLAIPRQGAVNVHASLLPKYRGAAPIPWALLRGEKVTGVTTMFMDEGMDTGDILLQSEISIGSHETGATLHEQLAQLGAPLLVRTIEGLKVGSLHPIPQDHSKASYAPPLKKEDGRIDWGKGAEGIDRQVRGFNPWPGAFTQWNGQWLKIYKGEVVKGTPQGKAGAVVWVGSNFIEVETGQEHYRILEVQLEGKRRMSTRDFLSGHPVSLGTSFT